MNPSRFPPTCRQLARTAVFTISSLFAFVLPTPAAIIDTVVVGDVGNPSDSPSGNGAVSYTYEIGKYEVTNAEYADFLNAVATSDPYALYNENASIDRSGTSGSYSYSATAPNKPVAYVSFWDAARFANWLTNGQPSGSQDNATTETGMYHLGGVETPSNASSVTRQIDFAAGEDGWAVASLDEWYKAAYYDGSGGYYEYPTQSDDSPKPEGPPGEPGSANYNSKVGSTTDVGSYTDSTSFYGTFDQGGNVQEWNDRVYYDGNHRGVRGGRFDSTSDWDLSAAGDNALQDTTSLNNTGFRVTSLAAIPEPSAYGRILGAVSLAMAIGLRRRRRGARG